MAKLTSSLATALPLKVPVTTIVSILAFLFFFDDISAATLELAWQLNATTIAMVDSLKLLVMYFTLLYQY